MSQKRDKQDIYNSREWHDLRIWKLRQEPLCEICKRDHGWVVSAQCVHHIRPIESARTKPEMWKLALDPANLQSLCFRCHADIHKGMGRGSKALHKERSDEALQRWIARQRKRMTEQ